MMRNLFILHFQQVEAYPPVLNLMNYLRENSDIKVSVCTTMGRLKNENFKENVYRFGQSAGGKIQLWLSYFLFNTVAILFLCLKRPQTVLYYETISSFPIYLYKILFSKVRVFVHYHEYVSLEEYEKGSKLIKWMYKYELRLLEKATWISQTNEVRLNKFLRDVDMERNEIFHLMPNYPSKHWVKRKDIKRHKDLLKIVFVGYSATEENSYIIELINWLKKADQKVQFDLYCLLADKKQSIEVEASQDISINYFKPVPYKELSAVLCEYDVGVILYKAKTDNYIHNAPNKLFEYLACGLDVWYPTEMQGIYEYDSEIAPKVIRIDFNAMEMYTIEKLRSKQSSEVLPSNYIAENVYNRIADSILN